MHIKTRHAAGFVLTAGLHIVLLGLLLARHTAPEPAAPEHRASPMIWLRATPASRIIPPAPPPIETVQSSKPVKRAMRALPAEPAKVGAKEAPQTLAPPPDASEAFEGDLSAAPAPTVSADEMLRIAKRDIAKIDQDLRKQSLHRIKPPDDSVRARLDRNFQQAKDATMKWYEAPKITELTTPGGPGGITRVYEIRRGKLRYCIQVSPSGASKMMSCPSNG